MTTEKSKIHGELFRDFIGRKDIYQYKSDFVLVLGVSKIDNWFRDKTFSKKRVYLIYSFFGDLFDPSPYGYEKSDLQSIQSTSNSNRPVKFYEGNNIQSDIDKISNYFVDLKNRIDQVQEKIQIYFYLARTKNESFEESTIFRKGQGEYLEHVFNRFRNSNLRYIRFLVLPLETNKKVVEDANLAISEALKLIFPETFKHIWDCFCTDEDRFELYVCSKPRYSYSVGIFDDDFLVKEHDKYENGVANPEMMLIYDLTIDGDEYISKMDKMYRQTLQKLEQIGWNNQAPVWKVDKEEFADKAELLFVEVEDDYEKIEKDKELKKAELNNNNLTTAKKHILKTEIHNSTLEQKKLKRKKKRWKEKLTAFDSEENNQTDNH